MTSVQYVLTHPETGEVDATFILDLDANNKALVAALSIGKFELLKYVVAKALNGDSHLLESVLDDLNPGADLTLENAREVLQGCGVRARRRLGIIDIREARSALHVDSWNTTLVNREALDGLRELHKEAEDE